MDLFKQDQEDTPASIGASSVLLLSGDKDAVKKKPPKRQPAWLYPWPAERRYSRILVKHMDNIGKMILDIYLPHLESLTQQRDLLNPGLVQKADDYSDDAQRLSESLKLNVENAPNRIVKKSVAMGIANDVNTWNSKEWQKQLRAAFGVNVFKREPFVNASLNAFTIENVALITNMEQTALDQVAGVVNKGMRQGSSAANIAKDIQERIGVSKSRAKFIARDQVGKLNGQLTGLRQTNLGVTTYIWRTAQDERVRPTHVAHNGKKFKWDRPPANTGAPGQDFQCFPGDSKVTSLKGAKKLFRRFYRGKLTELVTTDGVLSATPNHPILTTRGWIPINEINVGDNLVHIMDKRQSFANLNEYKSSITFEQIFNFVSLSFPFSKIPGSSSQFHSDGTNEEIDIINMDLSLEPEFHMGRFHELFEFLFSYSKVSRISDFGRLGNFNLMTKTIFSAPASYISGASDLLSFFSSEPAKSYKICLSAISWLDSTFSEYSGNNTPTKTILFGNSKYTESSFKFLNNLLIKRIYLILLDASNWHNFKPIDSKILGEGISANPNHLGNISNSFPSHSVNFNSVIDTRLVDYVGHVYNSETKSNNYNIANFTVHNCRCYAEANFDDIFKEINA